MSGCSASSLGQTPTASPNPKQPLIDEFERNVAKWQEAGIEHYAFTYTHFCFCPLGLHLVVAEPDGIRIDGIAVEPSSAAVNVPAGVPGLFNLVRRAIDGDNVTITYDPTIGVPIAMDSDPVTNAVDDELTFEVVDWTLEPPDDRLLGRLTAARGTWERHKIWSYRWSIAISCECVYEGRRFDITVRDLDPSVASGGKHVSTGKLEGVPTTIDRFFDIAASWVVKPASSARFDPDLGYPTRVTVPSDPVLPGQAETIEVVSFSRP